MKMTFANLNRVAANLLGLLRNEKLDTLEAVEASVDKTYDPGEGGEEFVRIERNGDRLIIGYHRRTGQTPIMLLLRPGAFKIMITAEAPIPGYTAFDESEDGDVMQDRKLPSELSAILSELQSLSTAKGSAAPAAAKGGKVSESPHEFVLPCSACGGPALRFLKGMHPGDDHLVMIDGEKQMMLAASLSETLGPLFSAGDLKRARKELDDGIPARPLTGYCVKCDAMFCAKHCPGGTCAKGHPVDGAPKGKKKT